MYKPTLEEFKRLAQEGNLVPVYKEVLADLETPVSAFLKIDKGDYSFLLESVEGGKKIAQYSFLGVNPSVIFQSKGKKARLTEDGQCREFHSPDPLNSLRDLMQQFKPVAVEGVPRFFGGAVGYIGYDMVRFFEQLPDETEDDLMLDDAFLLITDKILIFDHVNHTLKVVCNARLDRTKRAEEVYQEAVEHIEALLKDLRESPIPASFPIKSQGQRPPLTSNMDPEEFERRVEVAKEYIRAGDIFQVVLSQRFAVRITASPITIYRALRSVNPSPYMFFLKLKDITLVGASPELLVRVEGQEAEVRPIAGTRPRGRDDAEDQKLQADLLEDEKEKAEHIMLVDLGRNDIGRVSTFGSVKVTELMAVEKYSHVMHIVSDVKGKLRPGVDCYDVLRAVFPAGTLTGAPKIRAMEIIEELEDVKRGPYGGVIGYFSFSGNLDTCIIIRTILIKGDQAYIQAGAGIVADSIPSSEFLETQNKALALFKAIEIAHLGLQR